MRKITAVLGLFCLILSFSCKKDGLDPITPVQQTTSTGTISTDTTIIAAGSSVPNGASTGTKTTTGPTTGGSATTKTSTPTGAVSATSGSATVKATTPASGGTTGTTPTTPPTTTTPPPATTATPTMMTGIYADGVHDDTQALQKYLNVGDVTLAPGKTYNVTGLRVTYDFDLNGSTIHMTRTSGTGISLVTNGATVTNGSVTGIWSSSALGNPNGVQGMAIYADNVSISNVTVSSFPSYGIVVVGAHNNPSVTNCTITSNGYIGFYFDAETANTSGGVFSNNLVDQSMLPAATISESGAAIRGSSSNGITTSNWTITGNTFKMPVKPTNWSAEGIEVRYMTNSVISNNTFIAGSIGCSVVRSSGITVSANQFSGSDAEALEFADCKLCSTKSNVITSAFNIGILLDGSGGSSDITLNSDVISGTGSDCIEAYKGCLNVTVTNCTLTAAKSGKAINLMATSGVKIQNSVFIGNSVASMAVMLDTCPGNFSMTGGSVTNFKSCVITIYSNQSGLVTNNVIMSGVTVSGVPTALAKVVGNGASVGSNVVVSL
ncbi:right-handed parallel beta-helix repeat-containing protein [Mucilaginibacter ginsenosidivorans]|uniref:Right handed beta helix domain-containing protein n=1 Tax=Mucilaginibacter ginsenosidivorans TaxID=398053 RepID=A0A5B8V064_9SPHI|nr:right-handed parallel beta-helix repeat-containing protein [Mucilaginibacter ginsenosidivorans]QEC64887.1 hypothetical protein FRZ54_20725 [Mucilaginibacter ginsenosidivorans]